MANCEIGFVNQRIDENHSLEIFEMTTNTSEPIEKIINKELFSSEWMLKRLNVLSNGGKNMNPFSPLLVFLLNSYLELLDHKFL
jgi:hypothetical protein